MRNCYAVLILDATWFALSVLFHQLAVFRYFIIHYLGELRRTLNSQRANSCRYHRTDCVFDQWRPMTDQKLKTLFALYLGLVINYKSAGKVSLSIQIFERSMTYDQSEYADYLFASSNLTQISHSYLTSCDHHLHHDSQLFDLMLHWRFLRILLARTISFPNDTSQSSYRILGKIEVSREVQLQKGLMGYSWLVS